MGKIWQNCIQLFFPLLPPLPSTLRVTPLEENLVSATGIIYDFNISRRSARHTDHGMEADGESPGQNLSHLVPDRGYPHDTGASGLKMKIRL